jgi:hypothetical protein
MRLILAALFAMLIAVPAEAAVTCVSKDEEIAGLQKGRQDVLAKKLTDDEERAFVKATGAPFPETYSYVISWIDAKEYDIAVVSVFDEHNCLATRARLPKRVLKDFIWAES